MDRKEFIKTCGFSCLGLIGISTLIESCSPVKYINAINTNDQLKVLRSEFMEEKQTRHYVIVKTPALNFPIVLYRFANDTFSALLLECPHNGVELSVNGDLLSCSAHGSEFNNKGDVTQGPADQNLKKYKITTDSENIYIHVQ